MSTRFRLRSASAPKPTSSTHRGALLDRRGRLEGRPHAPQAADPRPGGSVGDSTRCWRRDGPPCGARTPNDAAGACEGGHHRDEHAGGGGASEARVPGARANLGHVDRQRLRRRDGTRTPRARARSATLPDRPTGSCTGVRREPGASTAPAWREDARTSTSAAIARLPQAGTRRDPREERPELADRLELHVAGRLADADREVLAGLPVVDHGFLAHANAIQLMRWPIFSSSRCRPAAGPPHLDRSLQDRTSISGSGRPILAAVPDGDARDFLAEAGHATLRPTDGRGRHEARRAAQVCRTRNGAGATAGAVRGVAGAPRAAMLSCASLVVFSTRSRTMARTRSRPCPSWRNPDAATLTLVCAASTAAPWGRRSSSRSSRG